LNYYSVGFGLIQIYIFRWEYGSTLICLSAKGGEGGDSPSRLPKSNRATHAQHQFDKLISAIDARPPDYCLGREF